MSCKYTPPVRVGDKASLATAVLVSVTMLVGACSSDTGDATGTNGLTPTSGSEPFVDTGAGATTAPEAAYGAAASPPTLPDGVDVVVVDPETGTTSSAAEQSAVTQPEETTPSVPEADPTEPAPVTSAEPADLENGEALSFTRINELRAELQLKPLTRDSTMDAFARDWSRTMAQTGELVHSTAEYSENIAFTSNLGISSDSAAEQFHEMWVNSPDHYANMSNEGITKIGVGLFKTEKGWYGTHVFQ